MTDTIATPARPPLGLVLASLLRADGTALVRRGRTVLLNLLVPIIFLVITDIGHGNRLSKLSINGPAFDIGLALSIGLMSSSVLGYSVTIAQDRADGVFQRLRVTPAATWPIMTSRLAVQVIANLVMTVIVLVAGSIIHRTAFSPAGYVLIVLVALLGSAVFLAIGQAVVGLVSSVVTVSAIGRVLYIVLLLLGLLGSTGVLGDAMKIVAEWSPVGALINLFEIASGTTAWGIADSYALIACALYVGLGLYFGIRHFHWSAR